MASVVAGGRGVGGLPSGFSKFGAVDGGSVQLTFDVQPASTTVEEDVTFTVKATGSGGTAISGQAITITIIVNQGSLVRPITATGTTDDDGIVDFSMRINKPGGYSLRATTANFSASSTVEAISEMFHITQ